VRAKAGTYRLQMDSDPFPEISFVGQSGGETCASKVSGGRIIRPPDARIHRNKGKLDHITSNMIDMERVLALYNADGYLDPLKIIIDPAEFERRITGVLPTTRRVSRFMKDHAADITFYGTAEPVHGSLRYYLPLFTVAKKSGLLRLIQDCRLLNSLFERPPSMDLPKIHDLIDLILAHEVMGQTDAVSFFYQFSLHEKIRKYFGSRLGGGRGDYIDLWMCRLPMGFSHAPVIGQRLSNKLVNGLGASWVDNFIVVGTKTDFAARAKELLRRAKEVNLELDVSEIQGKTVDVALGIEFNLSAKEYRMDPVWVEKAVARVQDLLSKPENTFTLRDLYTLAGTLFWRQYVMREDLCKLPHLLATVGAAARSISDGSDWEGVFSIPEEAMREIMTTMNELKGNLPKGPRNKSEPTAEVWSDASDTHWAFLLFEHDRLVEAHQGRTKEGLHIFYSELSTALGGLSAAARRGHEVVRSVIDNAAAGGCLAKRASSNFTANRWLSRSLITETRVQWVSTKQMFADMYTRIPHGCKEPVRLPPVGTTKQHLQESMALMIAEVTKDGGAYGAQRWVEQATGSILPQH